MRIAIATLAVAAALAAASAGATQQRSFVASNGSDSNLCTLAAPCRSFGAAIAQTNDGGEVIVLDSAGYGAVSITASVSLIAPPGVYAGISVFPGNDGVTINAPGKTVALRGLSINGQGGGIGVNVVAAARVRIEACEISGMSSNGIAYNASSSQLAVLDTVVRDNGGTGIGTTADATIVLDRVRSIRNTWDGFYLMPASVLARATITDSVFAGNGANGINVETAGSSVLRLQVDRATLASNANDGYRSSAADSSGTSVTIAHSNFHDNGANGVEVIQPAGDFSTVTLRENQFANHVTGIRATGAHTTLYVAQNAFSEQAFAIQLSGGAAVNTQTNNFGIGLVGGSLTTFGNF